MKGNSPKATVYLSPPISRALQAVPTQSLSGRLADICERYMKMVAAILERTQITDALLQELREAIRELGDIDDAWLLRRPAMQQFDVATRIAVIEMLDREQALPRQNEGEAK